MTPLGRHSSNAPSGYAELNRFSSIIADEALARGISVDILDPDIGEMTLQFDGRTVTTIQSLSELTSAMAYRRCDDKAHTCRVLGRAGLAVPDGRLATFDDGDVDFLRRCGEIVVKPTRGEGGAGVCVGITDPAGLADALVTAAAVYPTVLLERLHDGHDLRIIVIGDEVVAASVRRPPTITGTGSHTVGELVDELNAQRGVHDDEEHHSHVALDASTLETIRSSGFEPHSVPGDGHEVPLRRTANVHTGGTIVDVTDELHPVLADVALRAARAIDIPVLGLDLMVGAVDEPDYVIIEANEQPGLANHEPRPTAERFIDLLFPATRSVPQIGRPGDRSA